MTTSTSTSDPQSTSSTDNSSSTSSNRPASASSASSSTSNASSFSRLAPQFAPRDQRPAICGPEAPERPYPIYLRGEVEKGFGRGGKDLGCPTANLPSKVLGPASALSRTGIYYGFARVLPQDPDDPDIDDSLSLGGGIESAKSPSSPPTPQQDQLDEEGEESDYYDEDDDENEVVLGVSPVNTHFSNMDRNLNGNANENGSSSSNGNGNDSQLRRNNSLHAGVERVPKHKERQGSKSSTKSNKSIATLMAQLGKSDSNTNEGEGSNSNLNGAKKIESSEVKSSQSLSSNPTDNEVEKSAISNAQDRPTISTSDLNSSNNTSTKHPRNLSAASSSSSLKRGRKKPRIPLREEDAFVFPMVMSVGWNPFYNNTTKTAEVHIIHKFARDFYGLEIRVVVLGYIRPEYNYVDRDSLIEDIETDKKVGIASLQRRAYQDYAVDPFLGR